MKNRNDQLTNPATKIRRNKMKIKTTLTALLIASSFSVAQAVEVTTAHEGFNTLNSIPVSRMSSGEMDEVIGKGNSFKLLAQFRMSNPGLFSPSIGGKTVFGNAVYPYGPLTSYGSPFAKFVQQNAFQLMNSIVNNGITNGVNPYLSFFGSPQF